MPQGAKQGRDFVEISGQQGREREREREETTHTHTHRERRRRDGDALEEIIGQLIVVSMCKRGKACEWESKGGNMSHGVSTREGRERERERER